METEEQLQKLISFYENTKKDCPRLLENCNQVLGELKEETGWADFQTSCPKLPKNKKIVVTLQELQILLGDMLETHTAGLQDNLAGLSKTGDYVPELLRITKEEIHKEHLRLTQILQELQNCFHNPSNNKEKTLKEIQKKVNTLPTQLNLLQEELAEKFPLWGKNITGYAINKPYCEVLCRWAKSTLLDNPQQIEKTLREFQTFKHPFADDFE